MVFDSQQLDDFAQEAGRFCDWATGADGTVMSVPMALRHVSTLYAAALDLPSPFKEVKSTSLAEVEPPPGSVELVARRTATLPMQWYWEIFDPRIEDLPDTPGVGDITDDLNSIYEEVAGGLVLFDLGDRAEALWEWGFNFRIHWGHHAASALRAMHAYLSFIDPDGLWRDD